MSETLLSVIELAEGGEVLLSMHGYDELAADGILVRDAVAGISEAAVVEDYPNYHKGPAYSHCMGYSERCFFASGTGNGISTGS